MKWFDGKKTENLNTLQIWFNLPFFFLHHLNSLILPKIQSFPSSFYLYPCDFFFSVYSRQQNKSTPLSATLTIQLFSFFFLTECLSVCIWISTRTVTQLSGERRSRNIHPNNRSWQLLYFSFVFQSRYEHILSCANCRTVSFHVKGLVLRSLIYPTWQLFGPNLICGCWFWSQPSWEWCESITSSLESIMNLLHLYGILQWQDLCALIFCLLSYAGEEMMQISTMALFLPFSF